MAKAPGKMKVIEEAREVLRVEMNALKETMDALDKRFEKAMLLLKRRQGKIVVTGVGKSGLIGQKIAATLCSTGSPAVFMHAADAIHGDLGVVAPDDVVLMLSYSGQTEETLAIMPAVRRIGAKVIAMVGDGNSRLAAQADAAILLAVPEEADHLRLAPTSSALAALAVGDTIAALLSKWRGFRPEDFALYHPGGALGRRLLLTVRDLMRGLDETPSLLVTNGVHEVLEKLTKPALGAVLIVNNKKARKLEGIIVEGDLRRAVLRHQEKIFTLKAGDIMTRNPVSIGPGARAEEALRLMEDRPNQISVLPVVDDKGRAVGLLRLHDLLQIGFGKS